MSNKNRKFAADMKQKVNNPKMQRKGCPLFLKMNQFDDI